MAVYVDRLFTLQARESQAFRTGIRHGHRWCHMWADTARELHDMAARIGMKRAWFQNKPGFPHYDLVPPRREHAVRLGAIETTSLDWKRRRRAGGATYPCYLCGDHPQVGGEGRGAFLCVACGGESSAVPSTPACIPPTQ